jgi:regulation of enolase protein 1 (concanavalin A-like superfamily)
LLAATINAQWNDAGTSLTTTDNVGIGTTNPSEKLDLSTDKYYNSANENGIKLGNANEASVDNNKSHSFLFKTLGDANGIRLGIIQQSRVKNDIEVLSIKNDNVGIGAINPSEKLDLSVDKYYNSANENGIKLGNANEASVDENKSHSFLFKTLGDANGIRLGIIQQSRVKNDIEVLSIKNDNVGIGTTNPDMKLSVKGQIHAEEVKIDLSVPAPDYVFKKDYDLKSIEEVEKFILKNSHLPEIPSAKDFEQNGVMLAQMDMNLLKKIEELTLYTIQQQKEILQLKKQNSQIEKQEKEIEKLTLLVEKLLQSKK